ncbi:MAG: SprT family zinc-dependent metalloprotease [Syntrophobacteraceae bacterium]
MIDFDYQVRKSPRRKTLSICVYPDNRVVVAAPRNLSEKDITRFVDEKAGWVQKRLRINLEKQKSARVRQFVSGEKLLYLGKEYTLVVEENSRGAAVVLENGNIVVRIRPSREGQNPRNMVRSALVRWYADLALAKIEERGRHFEALTGMPPRSVTIKAMRSRWGSCSTRGAISFVWNIIMAPEPVLDYLVVHEFCHLTHHNHSAEYWKLVGSFIPDHRERRKWLRENGGCLSF